MLATCMIAGLLLINGWTLLAFYHDKACARAGTWRVRESNLLLLAAIGGSPGALAARQLFRHKTRKQPFSTYLWLIAAGQVGVAAGWLAAG